MYKLACMNLKLNVTYETIQCGRIVVGGLKGRCFFPPSKTEGTGVDKQNMGNKNCKYCDIKSMNINEYNNTSSQATRHWL